MKKLLLVFIGIIYSFAFFGNEKLELIWMNDGDRKARLLKPVVLKVIKKLREDYDVNYRSLKNYSAIYSFVTTPEIYVDKDKLRTGILADRNLFLKDAYYVVFHISKRGDIFFIKGIKYKKDGLKGDIIRLTLKKRITHNISKTLYNMLYFFVKSSIIDYKAVGRMGVTPLVIKEGNDNLKVLSFSPQKVIFFNDTIPENDIELAKKLGLVSGNSIKLANNYCKLLDMYLPNSVFINQDDEYSFEELYQQVDFKDGYKVYQYKIPTFLENRRFRCMGNDYTLLREPIGDYELNKLGILWKIKTASNFIKVGAVKSLEGENNVKILLVDEKGEGLFYENDNFIKKFSFGDNLKNVEEVTFENEGYKLKTFDRVIVYNPLNDEKDEKKVPDRHYNYREGFYYKKSNGKKIDIYRKLYVGDKEVELDFKVTTFNGDLIGGENGHLVAINNNLKIKKEYKGLKGDIVKIVKIDNKIVVITNRGELGVYEEDKSQPIRLLPQLGYSYTDMSVTSDNKYLLVINSNRTAYLFLTKVLLKKVKK